jgi:hypothetical protein
MPCYYAFHNLVCLVFMSTEPGGSDKERSWHVMNSDRLTTTSLSLSDALSTTLATLAIPFSNGYIMVF